jgi:hypothetical protein
MEFLSRPIQQIVEQIIIYNSQCAITIHNLLPARFGDTGQVTAQRFLAEADATETKAPHVPPRAPAHLAAAAHTHGIFTPTFTDHN